MAQLRALQKGWSGPLYPSVEFGLYGLSCPEVTSVPCALFLQGTAKEVMQTFETSHGCTTAKLKVGHWSVEEALSVIRALPIKLRLDFNHLWSQKQLFQLCHHLSPEQIDFLEDPGCTVPGFSHASDEISLPHSLTIWKPTIRGLPPHGARLILSSSMESSIGLHHIAALLKSHQIPDHILGIGTGPIPLKEGKLHFHHDHYRRV